MPVPVRILRALADDLPGARPRLSPREMETQDRILTTATTLMAHHGRAGLTMAGLAAAMRLGATTIRRHFPDLDTILFEILHRHLHAIAVCFGDITFDTPNRPAARRAAYATRTRTPFGAPTAQHLLLLHDRHNLPPDLAEPIEKLRTLVGDMLCPAHPEIALALLDTPELQPPQIEAMLATLTQAETAQPAPEPASPDPAPPRQPPAPSFQPYLVRTDSPPTPATPRARAGPKRT